MNPTKLGADQAAAFLRARRSQILALAKGHYTRLIDQYDPPGPNSAYVTILDMLDDVAFDAIAAAVDNLGEAAAQSGE